MTSQIIEHSRLYAKREDGKYQCWFIEEMGDSYRSVSGIVDTDGRSIIPSSQVTSEWRKAIPTNVGRSNERSGVAQCKFEISRSYRYRYESGYVHNIGDKPQQPKKISPMLCAKYEGQKISDVYSQAKLDGIRCIVTKDGMFSRNWKPIVSAPHIHEELMPLLEQGYVFDGELYSHDYKNNFNKIISLTRKTKPIDEDLEESKNIIEYWCFDLIENDMLFSERQEQLKELLSQIEMNMIVQVPTELCRDQKSLDECYSYYLCDGYEGQIIRYDAEYEYKRSKNILKRKEFHDAEFEIIRIDNGEGNWARYAKTVLCKNPNGEDFKATIKNDQEFCLTVANERDQYVGGEVTVRYQNISPDGVPRFPIATAIYKGKRDV